MWKTNANLQSSLFGGSVKLLVEHEQMKRQLHVSQ